MKLITFSFQNDTPRLGVVRNQEIITIEGLNEHSNSNFPTTMLELIDAGPETLTLLDKQINNAVNVGHTIPISAVKILAPIPRPRKNIIGIGLNYTEHVAESARSLDTSKELPQQPVVFSKPPTTVVGTGAAILHNKALTQQLDWEVELAVIIGKKAKYVKKEDALDYVFGYSVINDISARDCRRAGQWIVSKGQDTFAPMGPCIVTKNDIPNPHNLNLWLTVNGVEKQKSNTRYMLFNIGELIEDLSTVFTLEPGDIIATGTPAGVGAGRNPQEWLWPGDVVEATVEGIGTIINPVKEIAN